VPASSVLLDAARRVLGALDGPGIRVAPDGHFGSAASVERSLFQLRFRATIRMALGRDSARSLLRQRDRPRARAPARRPLPLVHSSPASSASRFP
jgi:hypothetical protein